MEYVRTRWETAEARLEGVIAIMDDRLIRALFTGILGFGNISEGSLVTPNTVITTLDDISTIKLDCNVVEVYVEQLAPGQTINSNSIVYRGQAFEGIVTSVGSRVDTSTRSVQVRAEIENSDGLLRPGHAADGGSHAESPRCHSGSGNSRGAQPGSCANQARIKGQNY
jgi:membrane fusion protein (multidrug efflux system)